MVTKLKNISYSGKTKFVMFVFAVMSTLVLSNSFNTFVKYDGLYGGTQSFLNGYDEEFGTNYGIPFSEASDILTEELQSLENISLLTQDNGEHTMQKVLGLNMDEYTSQGIGFYLVDNVTDEIISTSDKNIERNEFEYVSSEIYIESRTNNPELSKTVELYDYGKEEVVTFEYNENGEILNDGSVMVYEEGVNEVVYYHPYTLTVMYSDYNIYNEMVSFKNEIKVTSTDSIVRCVQSAIILAFILLYFIVVAGRTPKNDVVNIKNIDNVYIDILCLIVFASITIFTFMLGASIYEVDIFPQATINIFFILYSIVVTMLSVYLLTNISIKIKTKKFLDSLFVFVVIRFVYRKTFKALYKLFIIDTTWSLRILLVLGVVFGVIGLMGPGLGIFIVVMYFGLLIASIRLVTAIKEVANNEKFVADKKLRNIPFNTSLEQLEAISKNTNEVYIKGLKAQNTKTELITNVSHDLRTPLTSIVGYIDLLEKRGNDYDEETQEYIRVLKEKSGRMTQMVGDLFDLAKTSSGDVKLDLSKLDVKKLVEQTVSELDDFIVDENKIQLKLEEKLYILADGNKMYRVMQNLIDNALKYSLDGTRIYVEVFENDNQEVQIEFKNIANYEMNFKQDEITERFTRGDKSRSTEGSGLGLAIAETYTNLNGGSFNVVVDGDLFKVVMTIKKV